MKIFKLKYFDFRLGINIYCELEIEIFLIFIHLGYDREYNIVRVSLGIPFYKGISIAHILNKEHEDKPIQ